MQMLRIQLIVTMKISCYFEENTIKLALNLNSIGDGKILAGPTLTDF